MIQTNYTGKQIFLGIRKEMIPFNQKLDELKRYTSTDDKRVNDYYFHLWLNEMNNNPELYVYIQKKYSKLEELFGKLFGYYYYGKSSLMVQDKNGLYHPTNSRFVGVKVDDDKQEKFARLVDELVNSETFRNMAMGKPISGTNNDLMRKLLIGCNMLYLALNGTDKDLKMTYYLREDYLMYETDGTKSVPLDQGVLDDILYSEFPKDAFSEYHQRILENVDDVDVILDSELIGMQKGDLEIREDGKNLRLIRRNKKVD